MGLVVNAMIPGMSVQRPLAGNLVSPSGIPVHHHECLTFEGVGAPLGIEREQHQADGTWFVVVTRSCYQNSQWRNNSMKLFNTTKKMITVCALQSNSRAEIRPNMSSNISSVKYLGSFFGAGFSLET
jgi:hypothetical protein